MVRDQVGNVCEAGLEAIRDLVRQRIFHAEGVAPEMRLVRDIFDTQETLDQLCLMSGGHVRNLMQIAQEAIRQNDALPIDKRSVRLAIAKARNTCCNAVY